LFSPFQKARPLGIQLFEKSKSRLSKLQPARRKSSAPVGNLYPRHIMLKGVFLKGDIRKSGGIIPIATKKPTETAFNLEWAPIILLRSRFELRSEMPTKQDFLQLLEEVLCFHPLPNSPTPPTRPSPSTNCQRDAQNRDVSVLSPGGSGHIFLWPTGKKQLPVVSAEQARNRKRFLPE
jgi:hypothetical protein